MDKLQYQRSDPYWSSIDGPPKVPFTGADDWVNKHSHVNMPADKQSHLLRQTIASLFLGGTSYRVSRGCAADKQ